MYSFQVENPECKRRKVTRSLGLIESPRLTEIESLEGPHEVPWAPFEAPIERESDTESSDSSESEDAALFWSEEQSPTQQQTCHVARTPEQALAEMKAPQRSDLWLQARKNCITASQFGTALGMNPYSSADQMLIEKIWIPFRGNEATHWGTFHESDAAQTFQNFLEDTYPKDNHTEQVIREYGLLKSAECPWMAVSPDGILYKVNHEKKVIQWYVLEQKCPWFKRDASVHPQNKYPDCVPTQYRAQVFGVAGQLSDYQSHFIYDQSDAARRWPNYRFEKECIGAFFVVWTPLRTWITELPFEKDKWISAKEGLKQFYFSKMLPALTHFANGRLQENSLQARQTIYQ